VISCTVADLSHSITVASAYFYHGILEFDALLDRSVYESARSSHLPL